MRTAFMVAFAYAMKSFVLHTALAFRCQSSEIILLCIPWSLAAISLCLFRPFPQRRRRKREVGLILGNFSQDRGTVRTQVRLSVVAFRVTGQLCHHFADGGRTLRGSGR